MFGVWSDSWQIENYFDPNSGFQTIELFQFCQFSTRIFSQNLNHTQVSVNMKVVEDRLSYKVHVESLAWNSKDWGEKGSEKRGLDWYLMFQLSFLYLAEYQVDFSLKSLTKLWFFPKSNLWIKTRDTTFTFEVLSKTQQICKYKLLNIMDFGKIQKFSYLLYLTVSI